MLAVRTVPAGLTAMQALDRELDVEDAVRRPVRPVDRGHRRRRLEAARLVLVPERHRGRSQRRRLPLRTRATSSGGTSARGAARCASRWSSARSPSRSCTATTGHVRPVAVRYAAGQAAGARAIGRLLHATSVAPLSDTAPDGRECVFHSKRQGAIHRFAPRLGRCRLAGPIRLRRRREGAREAPRPVPLPLPGAVSPVPAAALLAALAARRADRRAGLGRRRDRRRAASRPA